MACSLCVLYSACEVDTPRPVLFRVTYTVDVAPEPTDEALVAAYQGALAPPVVDIRYYGDSSELIVLTDQTLPWSASIERPRDLGGSVYLAAAAAAVLDDPALFYRPLALAVLVDDDPWLLEDGTATWEEGDTPLWNGATVLVQENLNRYVPP